MPYSFRVRGRVARRASSLNRAAIGPAARVAVEGLEARALFNSTIGDVFYIDMENPRGREFSRIPALH